jgi:hypothetical protein
MESAIFRKILSSFLAENLWLNWRESNKRCRKYNFEDATSKNFHSDSSCKMKVYIALYVDFLILAIGFSKF